MTDTSKIDAYKRLSRKWERRSRLRRTQIRETERILAETIDQIDAIANTLEDLRNKLNTKENP